MDKIGAYVLLGAGGHAKVVLGLARAIGLSVSGVCDPGLARARTDQRAYAWHGIPLLGDDNALTAMDPAHTALLNGIGQMPGQGLRARLQARWEGAGFDFVSLVHPTAWVSPDARLGAGVQIMAGAVVQPGCTIGAGTIINTGATVDHDCNIGRRVHIAPGATLCGDVSVGDEAFIGAGATIINATVIGAGALVAAGVVQITNLEVGARSYGLAGQMRRKT